MKSLVCRCSLVIAALSIGAASVRATVYISANLAELTTDAQAVAFGRVVNLEARWLDDRRSIETLVTLEIQAYAKGDFGRTVTVRVPGGQMGPYRSVMLGAPTFVEGEEVVVFLGSIGPSMPHLVGLAQGVFRVRADAATGARMVVPEIVRMPGTATVEPARVVRGDGTRRPAPLGPFLDEVRALAAGRAR